MFKLIWDSIKTAKQVGRACRGQGPIITAKVSEPLDDFILGLESGHSMGRIEGREEGQQEILLCIKEQQDG